MFTLIQQFAESMTYVGQGVEARNERYQVEQVFGLTGGELADEPLKFRAKNNPAQEYGDEEDQSWLYHYDGIPEWAGDDFPDQYDSGVDYFTLVEIGCSYGSSAPAWLTSTSGQFYLQVKQYASSGECECDGKYNPDGGSDCKVGEGYTAGMAQCPMCGEGVGEEHGYIYVGDGCESVYMHVDFSCEECGATREVDPTNGLLMCACDEEEIKEQISA
jgi:hypothetical protein